MNAHPRSRLLLRLALLGLALILAVSLPAEVHADALPQLTRTLGASKHEKERIAAAVSLGRMRDQRALRPLVKALRDRSRVVRAICATALGHLGDPSALPALRRASRDSDKGVRRRAIAAIARINKGAPARPVRAGKRSTRKLAHYQIAGRETPLLGPKPSFHVVLRSARDDSKTKASKRQRTHRAKRLRELVGQQLADTPQLTTDQDVAEELALRTYSIDASIAQLSRATRGGVIEIECQIRVTVSNQRGKMLSILTGGAKVQVPADTFSPAFEPQHQRAALQSAVQSVHKDVIAYLKREPT